MSAHRQPSHHGRRIATRVLTAAALSTTLAQGLFATTFTWIRPAASTSGSWSNAANWQTSDVAVPAPTPGLDLPAGTVNDVIFGGPVAETYSNTVGQDYLLNSLVIPDIQNLANLNINPPSGSSGRILAIGAGGVTSNNLGTNVAINASSTVESAKITVQLVTDSTWTMNAPAPDSGARTFTINGPTAGTGRMTKAGTGLLVFNQDNPNWSGGITLSEGVVRLVGSSSGSQATGSMFGTGVTRATSDNNVNITSSSSSNFGQSDKWFHNDWVLDGTGTLTFGGSFSINFGPTSTITLNSSKPIAATRPEHQFLGVIQGPGGLTKQGGGIMVLGADNTYAGPTTVNSGTLTINGSLAHSDMTIATGTTVNGNGTLNFNLAGNDADLIVVNGTLDISALDLALNITGTQTQSEFVIADYSGGGTIVSPFASVTGLPVGATIDYAGTAAHPNAIVLTVPSTPSIPGDTNGDGVVDLADLNNVLNNFGATGASPGDDNNDGVVDLEDLNRVLNNFGDTAAASALSVVPEPSTLACLVAGLPLLARRTRKLC